MITRLAHVCIHTQDLGATEAFYRDVFAAERAFSFERAGEPHGYYLKFGDRSYLEVFPGEPGAVGNINHLCLETDDLDALIARARTHGHAVTDKKLGCDHSWQCWLTDPNGVRLEVHQYTEKSLQHRGGVARVDW